MLYLLDKDDFDFKLDENDFVSNINMSKIIYNKLKLASKTNELINTQWLKGVGKTFQLIKFAKEYGYIVVSPTAYKIRKLYEYGKITSTSVLSLSEYGTENIVVDEGVNNISELKEAGYKIITGFYTPRKEDYENFDVKIIDTLKNEVDCLTVKIKQARSREDFGTYKNLIRAYSEILYLIEKYK